MQLDQYKLFLNGKNVKAQPQATVNAKLILLLLLSTAKVGNINSTADGDSMRERQKAPSCHLGTAGADEETKLYFVPETCTSA